MAAGRESGSSPMLIPAGKLLTPRLLNTIRLLSKAHHLLATKISTPLYRNLPRRTTTLEGGLKTISNRIFPLPSRIVIREPTTSMSQARAFSISSLSTMRRTRLSFESYTLSVSRKWPSSSLTPNKGSPSMRIAWPAAPLPRSVPSNTCRNRQQGKTSRRCNARYEER